MRHELSGEAAASLLLQQLRMRSKNLGYSQLKDRKGAPILSAMMGHAS